MCLHLVYAEVHHVYLTVPYCIHSKGWQVVCIEGQEESRTSRHEPINMNWSKLFVTTNVLVAWL